MKLEHESRFEIETEYPRSTADELLLPQSKTEMDQMVDLVTSIYRLPPGYLTYRNMTNQILHLPGNQAFVTLEYLGNAVRKSIANHIAWEAEQSLRAKIEYETKIKPEDDTISKNESIQNEGVSNPIRSVE